MVGRIRHCVLVGRFRYCVVGLFIRGRLIVFVVVVLPRFLCASQHEDDKCQISVTMGTGKCRTWFVSVILKLSCFLLKIYITCMFLSRWSINLCLVYALPFEPSSPPNLSPLTHPTSLFYSWKDRLLAPKTCQVKLHMYEKGTRNIKDSADAIIKLVLFFKNYNKEAFNNVPLSSNN